MLSFFISKIMITNSEKIKNAIKIDNEITNKNQKMHDHFNEIELKIIHTKCDRYYIKLKNQFKFSKKILFNFLTLINVYLCQCSNCNFEFENKIIIKIINMITFAIEIKIKNE